MALTQSWALWIYTSLMLATVTAYMGGMQCRIKEEFQGKWLLDGHEKVSITETTVSDVGTCTQQDFHGRFLFMNSDGCFKCMAFTNQHPNLIQYKISYCGDTDQLEGVCNSIESHAPLHTLVKVDGAPIPCPYQGHWEFSYSNRSTGICNEPLSEIAACADNTKSQLNFRRCPKYSHTFDQTESLQCLATWNNGHDYFLYGKFIGKNVGPKDNPYRCFIYSVTGSQGKMSMSAGATCQDLHSDEVGPFVFKLKLRRDKWPPPKDRLPDFFPAKSQWRDVSGRLKFEVNRQQDLFTISDIPSLDQKEGPSNRPETRRRVTSMSFVDEIQSPQNTSALFLAFVTDDKCESYYSCILLTKIRDNVIQVQIGKGTSLQDTSGACSGSPFLSVPKHVLLEAPNPKPVECPMPGVHTYTDRNSGCSGEMRVGCHSPSEIEVTAVCGQYNKEIILQCFGVWTTESTTVKFIVGMFNYQRNTAYCLEYQKGFNGYVLENSKDCAVDTLLINQSPINFDVKPNAARCNPTPRPLGGRHDSNHPRDSYGTRPSDIGQGGGYITNNNGNSRGSRDRSDHSSNVINKPGRSNVSRNGGPNRADVTVSGSGSSKPSGGVIIDSSDNHAGSGSGASSILLATTASASLLPQVIMISCVLAIGLVELLTCR